MRLVGLGLGGLVGCSGDVMGPGMEGPPVLETIDLPPPRLSSGTSIEAALAARYSARTWTADDLTLDQIAQLCWAAQGVTHGDGKRTSPSAGALYPLELYVLTRDGVMRYVPDGHTLDLLSTTDVRDQLAAQDFVHLGPAVFLIAGVVARTAARYGDRAERFVHLEAGHACHGILLQAIALGLGGTAVGGFDEAMVRATVALPDDQDALYLVPVGVPA